MTQVFALRPRMRILLEASTESEWVAQHLEQMGHEVIVADPNYAPMYGQRSRRIKTDRRDVTALREACQHGTYRLAHRRSARQHQVQAQVLGFHSGIGWGRSTLGAPTDSTARSSPGEIPESNPQ